ncbi:MAG TPA: dihydrofolate reductase family protein [Kofleriaceae bacterium]
MRRIHMFQRVSADGYFSDPHGSIEWVTQDPDLDAEARTSMPEADAMMFGKTTYVGFKSFWPTATNAAPHGPPRTSDAIAAMGTWINSMTKYVFSHSYKDDSWANTQLLGAFDPEKVEAIKRGPGKAIMIFGSGAITSLLTKHGLVDDYTFVLSPIVLGQGAHPIRDAGRVDLELVEAKTFATGNVRLRYRKK